MANFANIIPKNPTDGIPYCTNTPLTSTEAFLADGLNELDPIAVEYGQAIVAVIVLTINGLIVGQNSYIVMQMDMGDGIWVDMNWCNWTGTQGSATFVMSNGIAGANTFQQTRMVGQNPNANGQNQMALGGHIRFVGKSTMVGGSSSSPGTGPTIVSATIKHRIIPLK